MFKLNGVKPNQLELVDNGKVFSILAFQTDVLSLNLVKSHLINNIDQF